MKCQFSFCLIFWFFSLEKCVALAVVFIYFRGTSSVVGLAGDMAYLDRTYVGPGLIQCQSIGTGPDPT